MEELLAVFPTTHLTLTAERVFKDAGLHQRTIMKPRRISSDCGLAIRLDASQLKQARELVQTADCLPATFYQSASDGWRPILHLKIPKGEDI